MIWFWLAVYLVTSGWAFRAILRVWFKDFGDEWAGVGFASLGLLPLAGPLIALGVIDWNIPTPQGAIPAWLKRIGGAE